MTFANDGIFSLIRLKKYPFRIVADSEGSDSCQRSIYYKSKNHRFWSDAESKMLSNWLKKEQGQRRERAIMMIMSRMLETRCLDP